MDLFSNAHICDAKITNLDDIANLEILPYALHFSEVMSFTNIIKDVDGLYICNWLLQGNDAITRVLISCIGKFCKPLDNIRRVASLARNSSITST